MAELEGKLDYYRLKARDFIPFYGLTEYLAEGAVAEALLLKRWPTREFTSRSLLLAGYNIGLMFTGLEVINEITRRI